MVSFLDNVLEVYAYIIYFVFDTLLFVQVAKALFDGQLLDVHFTRSFYKHILSVKVTYHDIEAVDPDYYKNLKWMLEVCFHYPIFCMNESRCMCEVPKLYIS